MTNKQNEQYVTKMYKENEKLIYFVINKYFYIHEGEAEDLYDAGVDGLLKAIKTFDENKDSQFSTYATKCIKYSIMHSFIMKDAQKRKIEKYTMSLNEPVKKIYKRKIQDFFSYSDEHLADLTIEDVLFDEESEDFVDGIVRKDEIKHLYNQFKHLTPIQQICIRCLIEYDGSRYGYIKSLCKQIGSNSQSFYRTVNRAKKTLRLINKSQNECTIEELQERAKILRKKYPIVTSIEEFKKYKNEKKKSLEK